MRYIKTYEYNRPVNSGKPKLYDYVICDENSYNEVHINLELFIKSNVGQIIRITGHDEFPYDIKYENVPEELDDYFGSLFEDPYVNNSRQMKEDEIKYWSKDKSKLEMLLYTKKYNL